MVKIEFLTNRTVAAAALLTAVCLAIGCIFILVYFMKRERFVMERIQNMLDGAIQGSFQDLHLDESKLSAAENSMWRYLCDNQAAFQKLVTEKEQIQALISDISHQTVIPISNIVLYSQLLEEWQTPESGQESLEAITAIREQAEKLDFLVELLVKISRLETGMIRLNAEKQNIAPVLSAVQNQFLPKAARKKIQFTVETTQETAVCDLKWTIEAVANIVDNAIKYTPCGGTVSVSVEPYSFFVRIDVADNGIGIPESEQANIFTRFYRSKAVKEETGLGIGLYLAREVLKAQNGYIKLTSEVGKGSIFSIFLLKEEISQN